MPRIFRDGVEETVEFPRQSWGDVLAHLESRCAADGRLVTSVRFDGVDQPSFRDPAALRQPITNVATIDIDTSTPTGLLTQSLDEAVRAVGTLASAAERVGAAFRGFDIEQANLDLGELAQGLGTLIALAQALGQAAGVDLDVLATPDGTGSKMIADLTTQAESLIAASDGGDWITVADIIEYDLAPMLRQWSSLFDALRTEATGRGTAS
jgi:hypothetical protein